MKRADPIEIALQRLHVTTRIALDRCILDDACATLGKAASVPTARSWFDRGPGRVVKIAGGLALAAAVLLVAIVLWNWATEESQPTTPERTPTARPGEASDTEIQLATERSAIEECYANRDVDGLIRLLGQALRENRILIALYLGRIGDERAIDGLSEQAEQWDGQPSENPFGAAVEEIQHRLQTPEPNEPNEVAGLGTVIVTGAQAAPVLRGTITDLETGEPLRRVKVYLRSVEEGRLYTVMTDEDGFYSFTDIDAPGSYEIWLSAWEHVTPDPWAEPRQTVELRRGGRVEKDFALDKGATIELTTVDESRRLVSGVYLYAAYDDDELGRGPKEPVRSNARGARSLGGLRPGTYQVVAAHPEYAYAIETVRLDQPGQIKPARLQLKRGVDVVGLLTCLDGLPPSGWMISAEPAGWPSAYSWPLPVPIADDGTFTLEHIVPGTYRVAVSIPVKGSPQEIWFAEVDLPAKGSLLELQAPVPSSYAPNAHVSLKDIDPETVSHVRGAIAGRVVDKQTGYGVTDFALRLGSQPCWCRVRDSQGRFVVDESVFRPVRFHVTAEGYAGTVVDDIDPEADAPVIVELDRPAPLRGVVMDSSGRALKDVTVSHRFGLDSIAVTDSRGEFEIGDVPAGSFSVWLAFRHPGYARTLKQVVVSDESPREVTVVMPRGAVIEGRLYDGQGRPRPFVPVRFLDEQQVRRGSSDTVLASVTTNADGFYHVDDVPPGLCYVIPDHLDDTLGVAQMCVVPQEGQHLWLDIGGPARTTGRLLRDGVPQADTLLMVRYRLDDSPGFEAYASTDAEGRFTFCGMPTGWRYIYWGGSALSSAGASWCRLKGFNFQAGVDHNVGDIDVADGTELLVELVGPAPRDVLDGYEVCVNRLENDRYVRFGQPVREDDRTFLFALPGLASGHYDVVAERPGYPSIHQPLSVGAAEASKVVRLSIPLGSGTVWGELVPFISTEVQPELVLRSVNGQVTAGLRPAPDGSYRVEHLPPGEYGVAPADLAHWTRRHTISLGHGYSYLRIPTNARQKRHIEEGYLALLIVTEAGMPLPGAELRLSCSSGMSQARLVADRGACKSFTARPGTYRLDVEHSGFRSVRRDVEVRSMEGRTLQDILEPLIIVMR